MANTVVTLISEQPLFAVGIDSQILIVFDIIDYFVELKKVIGRRISVHISLSLVKVNIVTVRTESFVRNQFACRYSDFNALFPALVYFVFFEVGKSLSRIFNPFYSAVSGRSTLEVKKTYFGCGSTAATVIISAVIAARNHRRRHA